MCGEVENSDHDKREVDPEIVSKGNKEDELLASNTVQFQGTPTRATIGAVAQPI